MKQKYPRPCNNCGRCCHECPCIIALEIIGAKENEPCHALERHGDKYLCGLITQPERYVAESMLAGKENHKNYGDVLSYAASTIKEKMLSGSGVGCDSVFGDGWLDYRIPIHLVKDEDYPDDY